ncbi:hypothetical protein ACIQ9Q_40485 [Streptomyces sp. NPDC094438]|uniref:hypothetical protein n=1 Tax=Streptomyces sp. NPDC094438 TaxID=3366061 RepID=UPI00380F28D0
MMGLVEFSRSLISWHGCLSLVARSLAGDRAAVQVEGQCEQAERGGHGQGADRLVLPDGDRRVASGRTELAELTAGP